MAARKGVRGRPFDLEGADMQRCLAMLADDTLSIYKIAEAFGVSHITFYKLLRRHNLQRHRGKRGSFLRIADTTLAPIDPRPARENEIRELAPWPEGLVFEDAAVPAEAFLGLIRIRQPEQTYTGAHL